MKLKAMVKANFRGAPSEKRLKSKPFLTKPPSIEDVQVKPSPYLEGATTLRWRASHLDGGTTNLMGGAIERRHQM